MRLTSRRGCASLSEIPSNKTLVAGAIQCGDGRGCPTLQDRRTGSSPAGVAGGGADFDVRLSAKARHGVADIAGVRRPQAPTSSATSISDLQD